MPYVILIYISQFIFINNVTDIIFSCFFSIFVLNVLFILFRYQNAPIFAIFRNPYHVYTAQQISQLSDRINNAQSNMINVARRIESDSQCPVCLGDLHYPVETNCGHLFCG